MRIPCPHCGERGHEEFSTLGSAVPRPDDASIEAWHDAVYLRDNEAGPTPEYWQHVHGCRAWLVVVRDTRNHAILGVEPARDAALQRRAEAGR